MSRYSSPIDQRPFQSKSKLESQTSLVSRYGEVAAPDVAEALHHVKAQDDKPVRRPSDVPDAA